MLVPEPKAGAPSLALSRGPYSPILTTLAGWAPNLFPVDMKFLLTGSRGYLAAKAEGESW